MKKCKVAACKNNVWGKGYCLAHQYLRPDFRKNTLKKITPKKYIDRKRKAEADDLFYKQVWNERPHQCTMCSKPLHTFNRSFVHHVLEKGTRKYKHLRHEKENGIIVCFDCHSVFHSANKPAAFEQIITRVKSIFIDKGLITE